MVPGSTDSRIEHDHYARYEWAAQFAENKKVLDIACGTGYGSSLLASNGALSVDGVDISHDALSFARDHFSSPSTVFHNADIGEFASGHHFGLITCFETIEHVPNPERALRNLATLLAEDGILLISSPNRPITSPRTRTIHDPPHNTFHLREYTPAELAHCIQKAGLIVDSLIHGQRVQRFKLPSPLQQIYGRVCKPHLRTSSVVEPIKGGYPRYFILQARAEL